MMNRGFGMRFFGGNPFDNNDRAEIKEKWNKMSDSEKLEFMNKRMEDCNNPDERFSIEAMDARCEAWMKMTTEEKQAVIDEKKQAFNERMKGMHGFFGRMHQ